MKYFPLIWAGLTRKKMRTVFTLLSILIAFLLFGFLDGIGSIFVHIGDKMSLDRLYVRAKTSITDPLPLAYGPQMESLPGVGVVARAYWFGGYYQDPKQTITSWAIDAGRYFAVFSNYSIPKDQIDALDHLRTGCIIGKALAAKYGWKIGDHIPLKSNLWSQREGGSRDWSFDIVGIYEVPDQTNSELQMYINAEYFEEARVAGRGDVSWYYVRVEDPRQATAVAAAIDARFANSSHETKTMTEKAYVQSFLKQVGDISFIVRAIVGAVFFTLLFLTGNTMMQSVRERIPEFAVLKTLGFSDRTVLVLVLAESLLLTVGAAALGLACSVVLFPLLTKGNGGAATLPPTVVATGFACAVVLALVTGGPPALRAGRLKVVDALAGR